ncbi:MULTISPECIES: maleylpyruvate isomerase family mycothiol-dependent enzyme [unclassified Mycolicibacterium]|uniref:maleylpyruvate isomerase family mycothiol-dependent enzyme n=1 Tax=unclassified Mycolicibacterium TaxID=2636767 RepID=UPI0012DC9ACF|nr:MULTISPECIES: maleylpyruvate isomerase family mycothiol-dependent enzyme [unclassified Mycolicibacterium]MUL83646.1 maleylpyruvate isomerase family mycothiol-dependent enzyme [Mycolicibacterium sp. CBMA 329]MUL90637.1 maleylpyruvate isomerase family mycothiol-dependent enzyme [Mycolicibacterium sp. CBMA 331]MUM00607.1 maleylpyruvate isomerase family mycothiol-dependent enzyme [Mycolicibacterium sp. CBMA 334]MUM28410.1 maleylpyruvate isomerase family mycothiol-dependent enzyme [Mycolicibacter
MLELTYRAARGRVHELAATLTDEQRQTLVPATPCWTVHELLAHLVGGAADAASGRLDGVTSDQWTARHVEERRLNSVDELLAEWDRVGPAADACLKDEQIFGPNLAADAICHEADLREALELSQVDRDHWQPFLEVLMLYLRKQLRHSTTLLIHDERGRQWSCGSGQPTTMLKTDGYELLRAMFSRRSQRQIAAWDWTPGPCRQMIERFGFFGPRDDDQPIPPPEACP